MKMNWIDKTEEIHYHLNRIIEITDTDEEFLNDTTLSAESRGIKKLAKVVDLMDETSIMTFIAQISDEKILKIMRYLIPVDLVNRMTHITQAVTDLKEVIESKGWVFDTVDEERHLHDIAIASDLLDDDPLDWEILVNYPDAKRIIADYLMDL